MALPGFIRHILGAGRFPLLKGQDVPVSAGVKTPLEIASESKLLLSKPDFVPTVPTKRSSKGPKNGIRKLGDQ